MTGRVRNWWRWLPPSGPVISFLLIFLVLLSAVLYYRAVKIQRFLEPALALSQPRNEFTKRIHELFRKEFGERPPRGLKVGMSSIRMQRALVFQPDGRLKPEGKKVLHKLARVFLALLQDEKARSEIDHIMIISRFAHKVDPYTNVAQRMTEHMLVGFIQDALFLEVPALGRRYMPYFMSGTGPLISHDGAGDVVDFLIVPSEYLHIEVLERLEKYAE
ncbi:MAG: hypothetical protein ACYC7L_13555 [Nitrospirota bacterium]